MLNFECKSDVISTEVERSLVFNIFEHYDFSVPLRFSRNNVVFYLLLDTTSSSYHYLGSKPLEVKLLSSCLLFL